MSNLVLEQIQNEKGLDNLLTCLCRGTQITHLEKWISRALVQIEVDDTLDPRTSDELAEILMDAQDAFLDGHSTTAHFQNLFQVYNRGKEGHSLKDHWIQKKDALSEKDISTELWLEFQDVVDCVLNGDFESGLAWIEETEARFLGIWEEYEGFQIVENEITGETVLGHQFLRDGVEHWLEALAILSDMESPCATTLLEVRKLAIDGQKFLVLVQLLEENLQADRDFYFAQFN